VLSQRRPAATIAALLAAHHVSEPACRRRRHDVRPGRLSRCRLRRHLGGLGNAAVPAVAVVLLGVARHNTGMVDSIIPDKSGRLIGIHDKPGGWKLSAYQRDVIYQRYQHEDVARSPHRLDWIRRIASEFGSSATRCQDLLREGGEPGWDWWVGCSRR
jgi:hypothetical protein